jgi:hypothetical protein
LWVAVGLKAHRLISTLVERERVQADLVANVSHEFRTPLNIIGGYAQLLLEGTFGTIPEEAIPVLRTLTDTNRSLGELVNNFLQYARADAGVSSLQSDAVATSQLAQELRRLGIALLEEKPVTFKVNIDAAPRSFASDSVKLRTILRNLIVNAAKFTTEGEVALEISTKDANLVFRVRDTPGHPSRSARDGIRAVSTARQLVHAHPWRRRPRPRAVSQAGTAARRQARGREPARGGRRLHTFHSRRPVGDSALRGVRPPIDVALPERAEAIARPLTSPPECSAAPAAAARRAAPGGKKLLAGRAMACYAALGRSYVRQHHLRRLARRRGDTTEWTAHA